MKLLGPTIEKIAWNKGGIMKEGCRAFTVPQPETAMKTLKERSIEKKVIHYFHSMYLQKNIAVST